MVRQTSRWGQLILLSLISIGGIAFLTSWIYRIDEVITAQGRLIPKKGGVEVKSPITGRLEEILIESGEVVEEGQKLIRYDVMGAKIKANALTQQIKIEENRQRDQKATITKRIETLERNLELDKVILNRLIPLHEQGAISEIQILNQENKIEGQKDGILQLITRKSEIQNDSNSRLTNLRGELEGTRDQLKNEYVLAPINGTVFNIKPDNNKYVTQSGEVMLNIVPKGELNAEVNISNRDIGFIKKGQGVNVRIDAFPYTEYGDLDGTIKEIGADALPPNNLVNAYHFPVSIDLKKSYLETRYNMKVPLQAGMTITTNIKLRDRRLIELLSDIFADKSDSIKRLRQF